MYNGGAGDRVSPRRPLRAALLVSLLPALLANGARHVSNEAARFNPKAFALAAGALQHLPNGFGTPPAAAVALPEAEAFARPVEPKAAPSATSSSRRQGSKGPAGLPDARRRAVPAPTVSAVPAEPSSGAVSAQAASSAAPRSRRQGSSKGPAGLPDARRRAVPAHLVAAVPTEPSNAAAVSAQARTTARPSDDWNILLDGQLGRSARSIVWRAHFSSHRGTTLIAAKEFDLRQEGSRAAARREALMLKRFSGGPFIEFRGWFERKGKMAVLMAELAEGNLRDLVLNKPLEVVDLSVRARLFGELLEALEVLAEAGVVHRAIMPSNLLVATDESGAMHLKVADFGAAYEPKAAADGVAPEPPEEGPKGSMSARAHWAPESWRDVWAWTPQSDVYAGGLVLYAMLFGPLVSQMARKNADQVLASGKAVTERWIAYDANQDALLADARGRAEAAGDAWLAGLVALLARMLSPEPSKRPSAAQARKALHELGSPTATSADSAALFSSAARGWLGLRPGRPPPAPLPGDIVPEFFLGWDGVDRIWRVPVSISLDDEAQEEDLSVKVSPLVDGALPAFARELSVMKRFSGGPFVELVGHSVARGRRLVFSRPAARGDLGSEVIARPMSQVGLVERMRLFEDLLEGLAQMHEAGFVHRDVRPEALLIVDGDDGLKHLKIADMGVACGFLDKGDPELAVTWQERMVPVGNSRYSAPELRDDDLGLSPGSDLFAAGVVLYELVLGPRALNAFSHDGAHPRLTSAMNGRDTPTISTDVRFAKAMELADPTKHAWFREIMALMAAMLSRDPLERPCAAQALTVVAALLARGEEHAEPTHRLLRRLNALSRSSPR